MALNVTKKTEIANEWVLYILECRDGTLYTGISNNVVRRLEQHNAGEGARYTRARRPVHLVYLEPCADRSSAGKRECAVKKLSREEKRQLVAGFRSESGKNVKGRKRFGGRARSGDQVDDRDLRGGEKPKRRSPRAGAP